MSRSIPYAPVATWQSVLRQWLTQGLLMATGAHRPPTDSQAGNEEEPARARQGVSGVPEFDAFFTAFEQPLFGYVRRIVLAEEIAVEIVQETFLRAWVHFDAVQGYERPQAWLYRVATHLALNQRRDHHTIAFTEMHVTDGATLPGDVGERWADPLDLEGQTLARDTINQILGALPQRQRAALLLRVVYGLSFAEVAQALGMTPSAARKTLSRAREQFRVLFAAQERE